MKRLHFRCMKPRSGFGSSRLVCRCIAGHRNSDTILPCLGSQKQWCRLVQGLSLRQACAFEFLISYGNDPCLAHHQPQIPMDILLRRHECEFAIVFSTENDPCQVLRHLPTLSDDLHRRRCHLVYVSYSEYENGLRHRLLTPRLDLAQNVGYGSVI